VRDISAIGAVPGLIAFEPCCEREARMAIRWAVEENAESTYLRFVNVPLDLPYTLAADYKLQVGQGTTLRSGEDVAIVGYGTALLSNAYRAAEQLAAEGIDAAVINLPWLNRIDEVWVREALGRCSVVVTLDNHYLEFGQGVMVAAALAGTRARAHVVPLGLTGIPACGSNADVLAHHGLDAASIARVVRDRVTSRVSA
jgi:transketolase